VAIKYEQVIEQFHVPDMLDKRLLLEQPETVEPLHGAVNAANLSVMDSDGIHQLEALNFEFPIGAAVAVVGESNSGRNLLPQLFARLVTPSSGRLLIGETDLNSIPLAVSGQRIGYVGPSTYLFATSVRENLLLGLSHRPHPPPDDHPADQKQRVRAVEEARNRATANSMSPQIGSITVRPGLPTPPNSKRASSRSCASSISRKMFISSGYADDSIRSA